MKAHELATKLAAFQIDHGVPELSFTARLARENRWTLPFAERVTREYFRFIYLAAVADHPVTPSVAVDQAWHLHLCYTRSYWIDLCQQILDEPLHHGPTQGGPDEKGKYREQYERTLELYQHEFGEAAPAEIWPSSKVRFSPEANPVSVASDRFLIIEKDRLRNIGYAAAVIGIAALGSGAVAQSRRDIAIAVTVGCAFAVFVWWLVKRSRKGGKGSSCGSGCGGDSGCGGCGGD